MFECWVGERTIGRHLLFECWLGERVISTRDFKCRMGERAISYRVEVWSWKVGYRYSRLSVGWVSEQSVVVFECWLDGQALNSRVCTQDEE